MINAVLLDVDGTLLDTKEYIFQAFLHALQTHDLPIPSLETLSNLMGLPLEEVYQSIAPGFSIADLSVAHRAFQAKHMHLVTAFPHVLDALDELHNHGVSIGAVTTRKKNALASIAHAGLKGRLDTIVTGDDVNEYKPDPKALRLALTRLDIPPEQAVMIGDTWVDIHAGKNTGAKTIAVTYGFGTEASLRLHHPDAVVGDISKIVDIIYNW